MSKYTYAVFIGRFQPYHKSHHEISKLGLEQADNLLFVLGSAFQARDVKNPFKAQEREAMIRACFSKEDQGRLHFLLMEDLHNLKHWTAELGVRVLDYTGTKNFCLVGYKKDHSTSGYLRDLGWTLVSPKKRFPQDATDIRHAFFKEGVDGQIAKKLGDGSVKYFSIRNEIPAAIFDWLKDFQLTSEFEHLKGEFSYSQAYIEVNQDPAGFLLEQLKKEISDKGLERDPVAQEVLDMAWGLYRRIPKYPVQFITADAVIFQGSRVLLGRRKYPPGKGLLALPGGFVKDSEFLLNGAIREAKEETSIVQAVSRAFRADLRDFLQGSRVFDEPDRSLRGRTVTHAFCFKLPETKEPLQVKAGDDLEDLLWLPVSEVRAHKELFFEDHLMIIESFMNQG